MQPPQLIVARVAEIRQAFQDSARSAAILLRLFAEPTRKCVQFVSGTSARILHTCDVMLDLLRICHENENENGRLLIFNEKLGKNKHVELIS